MKQAILILILPLLFLGCSNGNSELSVVFDCGGCAQWQTCDIDTKECVCDTGYHDEDGSCVIDAVVDPCALIDCMEHSTCDAGVCSCDDGYYNENDHCIVNQKQVNCDTVTAPNHGSVTVETVTITWIDGNWSTPAICNWSCDTGYHQEGDQCVKNTKIVRCLDQTPENGTSQISFNPITWQAATSEWEDTPICNWSCNDEFHTEDGETCVTSKKMLVCIDRTPEHATHMFGILPVYWTGTEWPEAPTCSWYCDDGYHTEDDLTCVVSTQTVTCRDIAPKNGTSVIKESIISWTDDAWEATPICKWSCDENYVSSGRFCIKKSSWTVMVYLDADNNLEGPGIQDFNEMEKGLYDAVQAGNSDIGENLNLIVLIDRTRGEDYSATEFRGSDWTDTRLYRVKPDNNMTYFNSERLDDGGIGFGHIANLGEKNMGDPDTLSWFINYTKENFKSDNYALILWNHGGGARSQYSDSTSGVHKAICWDEDNGDDPLYMNELQTAVATEFSSTEKLDLIGFDACFMATIEVAYEFRDLARYMVGSMNSEQGDGWDYKYIFGNIKGTRDELTLNAGVLAKLVVEAYEQFIEKEGISTGETQSAMDLSQLGALKTAIDQFAADLYSENKKSSIESIRNSSVHYDGGYDPDYPYFDLYDFVNQIANSSTFSSGLRASANSVIDVLTDTIIKTYGEYGNGQSYYYAEDTAAARGLTIFFSRSSSDYNYNEQSDWYTDMNASGTSELGDGYLDFANTTDDDVVNTWKELMDAWYD